MKGSILLAAAAAAGASASAHRHAHRMFAKRVTDADICVPSCTTVWTTIYGEATLVPNPPSPPETSSIPPPPPPSPVPEAPTSTYTPPVDLPTDTPEICPTPGEYTFPATTITVSETTTVCAPDTTQLPEGTHTYGGVTTEVEHETTIVVPYPTEQTNNGVVTSVIETTTYVCPEAGTYTIAPTTTVVVEETVVVFPTITTVVPGTYTRPAVTTTVTETNVVVICPWTSEEPAPPAPTAQVHEPAPEPEPTYAPEPEPEPTPEPQPEPEQPGIGGGEGDHWAITYTPYSEDASGSCKTAAQVDADIKRISESGFNVVRIYSTDCDTLENVGGAVEKYGLQLIIGIFVKDTCNPQAQDIKDQVDAIRNWAKWQYVQLVVVGNECIFQGRCNAASLRELIVSVKGTLGAAGYNGPYTTAETLNVWEQPEVASALCSVIDIVGGQIHPYFNADVAPSEAGAFVKNQLDILENDICGPKPALNLECGWPTGGNPNGKARPGLQEQRQAISSIREAVGEKTVFFSFHNDQWKDPGACGCEQYWGCGDLF
ncbi:glycoside hydrolase family 17 protein [Sodiomyces alcalophilus JCM 7366]|uniref:glycoside hydrolase family 17 protein n=1 Tax=Sodiomyces alcalophilus JCM 7366 TaxID=591952 RepID=UPI0039B64B80